MGNLLKREQTVKENNFFDSEHFSEPAASHTYKNPNFEPDPAVKGDLRNVWYFPVEQCSISLSHYLN